MAGRVVEDLTVAWFCFDIYMIFVLYILDGFLTW